MKKVVAALLLMLGGVCTLPAAEPPSLLNYQGVLRDASDRPLDGAYDMLFRFYDGPTGGTLLLTDAHTTAQAVVVDDGLFDVRLGSGTIVPGTYGSLADLFAGETEVYLEVQVESDAPMTPRIPVVSVGYALNTDRLDGSEATQFLRSDSSDAFTSGTLAVNPGATLDVDGTLRMDGTVLKSGTGLVENLNADLLDGYEATAFSSVGHVHAGSDITSPVADADCVDGYDAGHLSGQVAVSDGTLCTDLNADLLDGHHANQMVVPAFHSIGTLACGVSAQSLPFGNRFAWIFVTPHSLKDGSDICKRYGLDCTEVVRCSGSGPEGCTSWSTGLGCGSSPLPGRYWMAGQSAQNGDAYACCE